MKLKLYGLFSVNLERYDYDPERLLAWIAVNKDEVKTSEIHAMLCDKANITTNEARCYTHYTEIKLSVINEARGIQNKIIADARERVDMLKDGYYDMTKLLLDSDKI